MVTGCGTVKYTQFQNVLCRQLAIHTNVRLGMWYSVHTNVLCTMLAFVFERSQCFDQCVTFTTHQKVQFIDVSIVQPMSSLLWDYRELFSLSIMIATAINTHEKWYAEFVQWRHITLRVRLFLLYMPIHFRILLTVGVLITIPSEVHENSRISLCLNPRLKLNLIKWCSWVILQVVGCMIFNRLFSRYDEILRRVLITRNVRRKFLITRYWVESVFTVAAMCCHAVTFYFFPS